jgi:hypothetical protein
MAEQTTESGVGPKSLEKQFSDWEGNAFGFGYGSGEPHILPALKKFLSLCPPSDAEYRCYDYEQLERELTGPVTWFLINVLGHQNIIEYGSSPRFAWLTDGGYALKAFVGARDDETLINIACERAEDDVPCYPNTCNCGPNGYEVGRKCINVFWGNDRDRRFVRDKTTAAG